MISSHTLLAIAPAYASLDEAQARLTFVAKQRSFVRTGSQVGFVQLVGTLTKADLVEARQQINDLAVDERIGEILVLVDSPGGTIAGTNDLHLAVSRAAERIRVTAFIEDLGASAAYWAIAGATEIVVNPTGNVGSLGVFVVLTDASKALERAGVDVIVIRSGPGKGAGIHGAKISPEQLSQLQEMVDGQARHFFAAVARGRGLNPAKVRELGDGRLLLGEAAVAAGLVDRVGILEDVVAEIGRRTAPLAFAHLSGFEAESKYMELVEARVAAGDTESWARHLVDRAHPQLAATVNKQRQRPA